MSALNYTPLQEHTPKKYTPDHAVPKEAEPLSMSRETSADEAEIQEVVEHTQTDTEVKEFVEVKKETPEIPVEVQKAGVEVTASTQFPSYQSIKLPLSDDQILIGQKAPITSSLRWLATLASFMLSQAHITLTLVQGKATRVLKR